MILHQPDCRQDRIHTLAGTICNLLAQEQAFRSAGNFFGRPVFATASAWGPDHEAMHLLTSTDWARIDIGNERDRDRECRAYRLSAFTTTMSAPEGCEPLYPRGFPPPPPIGSMPIRGCRAKAGES
jgi:hypothetical protein